MLHIGDNKIVARQNIVAILPDKQTRGAMLYLADKRILRTPIAAATLRKRLRPVTISPEKQDC